MSYYSTPSGSRGFRGSLELTSSNRSNMVSRNSAYLPSDDKGHTNAAMFGGPNNRSNVVPQSHDVNHGSYYQMEAGERTALENGASIESDKLAFASNQPGGRPDALRVNDQVTTPDGRTETISTSYTNATYAEQEAWNDASAALPDTFDAPNPGDGLRDSMSSAEYSDLMEATDSALPEVAELYEPSDGISAGEAVAAADTADAAMAADDVGMEADTEADAAADAEAEADSDGAEASCDDDD